MNFIDKEDRIFLLFYVIDDRFKTLFKIAAIPRAGEHRSHIEGENLSSLQNLGHVAFADLKSQTLGQRGLSNAGFAYIKRVIFPAAAQNLDRAFDLSHAANDRIDLAVCGFCYKLNSKAFERLFTLLGAGAVKLFVINAVRKSFIRIDLRNAVRDVIKYIEPRYTMLPQEINGERMLGLIQRRENVAAVDRSLSAALGL